jgi:hypothetical protein
MAAAGHRRHGLGTGIRAFLIGVALGSLVPGPAVAAKDSAAGEPAVAALLQIPAPSDPWRVDTRIGRYFVRLELPKDAKVLASLPEEVRTTVHLYEKRRAANLRRLKSVATGLDAYLKSARPRLVPEYDVPVDRVVLGLHPSDADGGAPLHRIAPVIAALPREFKIDLLVPEAMLAAVRRELDAQFPGRPITTHSMKVTAERPGATEVVYEATRWMRDLFAVVDGADGRPVILLPLAHKQIDQVDPPDNDYVAKLLSSRGTVVPVPLFFRSGNLSLGRTAQGKRILFVGKRELSYNQNYFYNAFFYIPPAEALVELLRRLTGADAVQVLPNTDRLFHLDMAMVMLGEGKVGVIKAIDRGQSNKEDMAALVEIRATLRQSGFEVVDVDTTSERIAAFQSPVNALFYRERGSGRRWALVPQFPDVQVSVSGRGASLNESIRRAYEGAGVRVVPVEDRLHPLGGNTHCATNVIR